MYKVMGHKRCRGTFDSGKEWQNLRIYCITDDIKPSNAPEGLRGEAVDIIKAPYEFDTTNIILGRWYEVFLDKYGKVKALQEVET